jgi:hypothetical protein
VHGSQEPESSLHSNTGSGSRELKANVALVELVYLAGPELMLVPGGVLSASGSIVHDSLAGLGSVFPAASVARTLNVCDPALRPLYSLGLVHDSQEPESRLHSNTELGSLEPNAKEAVVELVEPLGPEVIAAPGGVLSPGGSIVHVCVAGLASVLSAASVARTLKVCEPMAGLLYAFGLVQAAQEPESSLHSNSVKSPCPSRSVV